MKQRLRPLLHPTGMIPDTATPATSAACPLSSASPLSAPWRRSRDGICTAARRRRQLASRLVSAPLTLLLLITPQALHADDWPQWRGAERRGVWHEDGILDRFPDDGLRFAWRAPVGPGYGGPAVAAGRVFVTDFERLPGNRGRERLLVLDEQTGRKLWEHAWESDMAGLQPEYANGPRATPTVDGDRVHVLGSAGHLAALAVDDGRVLWQRDLAAEYGAPVQPWGFVGAPLVHGQQLITLVGGEPNAMVVAFDRGTGEELWRSMEVQNEPGYNSPVIYELGGRPHLIIWHPKAIAGLDPDGGEVLWQFPCEVQYGQTIATAIQAGDQLLVSSASHGSTLIEVAAAVAGGSPRARIVWQGSSSSKTDVDGLHAFNATPAFDGDMIYGVGGLGALRAIDRATGKEVWATFEPSEDARIATAFLVRNKDRYFISNDRGELILARLSRGGYHELDRTSIIEPTTQSRRIRRELGKLVWVHPAYANGHIVHRNDREIVRASLLAVEPASGAD